jgi:hypothetical protein
MIGKSGLFARRKLPQISPDSISGLTAWLDASDSSRLFDSDSGGQIVAAGGHVARFEDKSGNGRHFSTLVESHRPTRQTGVKNGLDVLRFDGANNTLLSAAALSEFVSGTGSAVFIVAKASAVSGTPFVLPDTGGLHGFFGISGNSVTAFSFDGAFPVDEASVSHAATEWTVFAATHNGSTLTVRANGVGGAGAAHGTKSAMTAGLRIGRTWNQSAHFNGDVAEIITYNVALSTTDRDSVESYLQDKWAI